MGICRQNQVALLSRFMWVFSRQCFRTSLPQYKSSTLQVVDTICLCLLGSRLLLGSQHFFQTINTIKLEVEICLCPFTSMFCCVLLFILQIICLQLQSWNLHFLFVLSFSALRNLIYSVFMCLLMTTLDLLLQRHCSKSVYPEFCCVQHCYKRILLYNINYVKCI